MIMVLFAFGVVGVLVNGSVLLVFLGLMVMVRILCACALWAMRSWVMEWSHLLLGVHRRSSMMMVVACSCVA